MHLPESFTQSIYDTFGQAEGELLLQAIATDPHVSIRLNNRKIEKYNYLPQVDKFQQVPWCTTGFYLESRPKFTFNPLLHQGAYYVQEASSMFIEQVISQYVHEDVVCLDLCASPGGKSTLLNSLISSNSLLISNEIVGKRAQILSENMQKWGASNVIVTNNAPASFRKTANIFDVIVTDVPCSGEGMFRKDEQAIAEWSLENVSVCAARQRDIIEDIWGALKPGGLLIYSTCTFNMAENEDNIRWITEKYGAETLPVEYNKAWGISESLLGSEQQHAYHFLPHKTKGEGFFMAVLRKPKFDGESCNSRVLIKASKEKKKKQQKDTQLKAAYQAVAGWIQDSESFELRNVDSYLYAFPTKYIGYLELLKDMKFHILHAGIPLAEVKGKTLVPSHGLALSNSLKMDSFETFELSYEQAINYLRKEAVTLPATTSKGFVLLTYKLLPLGFVKNIGPRSNNLYPSEWKIRTGYVTIEEQTTVL